MIPLISPLHKLNTQDLLDRVRSRIAQSAQVVARAKNDVSHQKDELLSAYNIRIARMLSGRDPADRHTATQPGAMGSAVPLYPQEILALDGPRFRRFVQASYLWLRQQEPIINSYNVYPVPDGDTGTNMMHTMRSAWEACQQNTDTSLGAIAHAISQGALRGSRGNSGIILSQIWRGFARAIDGKTSCSVADLARALRESANTAYAGVNNPVEGTMLTVARETADAAERAAKQSGDLQYMLDSITRAAFESVQRTPSLLHILKEAGVVDSGGYGLYVILDGMRRFAHGESMEPPAVQSPTQRLGVTSQATPAGLTPAHGTWGYDVQFTIHPGAGGTLDVDQIRTAINAMGEYPLVMGDTTMVKVHLHVIDPGAPISYGARLGTLHDVIVEDMQAQADEFTPGLIKPNPAELTEVDVAIVAVAAGNGLIRAFKDVGVRAVVPGGQTMNPSVEDLLQAIKQARARHVILLPNNGNIIMAAQQAAQLSEIPTKVVPTRTIPQGIAAAIAFNFERDLDGNVMAMNGAAKQVVTAEVTTATRTATVDGVNARVGQIIGLLDDKLTFAGEDMSEVVIELLEMAQAERRELITLYYGNGMARNQADNVAQFVRQHYPSQVVDLYEGQQPYYYFTIGIE